MKAPGMGNINAEITSVLLHQGASLVGFADIHELPANIRQGMNSAVSIAVSLDPTIIKGIGHGPTRAYYQEYRRVNSFLSQLCIITAEVLQQNGYHAVTIEPTVEVLNYDTLATELPHKTVATRASMGWIGKSALLITEQYGAAVRLATVLCDAPCETGTPVNVSRCGKCRECVICCPANALSGNNWKAGIERKLIYDAFACCKTAQKLSGSIGIQATICGICIYACPLTQHYISGRSSGI